MTKPRIDLTNRIFGNLTVLRIGENHITPSGSRKTRWHCVCSCGKETLVHYQNLTKGVTASCGCKSRGIGKSSKFKGQPTWFTFLWNQYTRGARNRNLVFDLTHEEFKSLIQGNCSYCGEPPSERNSNPALPFIVNGIDRKINSIGYTKENTSSCCELCNRMKSNRDSDLFLEHIKKIANHVRA